MEPWFVGRVDLSYYNIAQSTSVFQHVQAK